MTLKEKKQRDIEKLRTELSKEELQEYFNNHTYRETMNYFREKYRCSEGVYTEVRKSYGIKCDSKTSQAKRLATNIKRYGAGTKPRKPTIDRDLLYKYYINEYLSIEAIIEKFEGKYTRSQIRNALSAYQIKRNKKDNPNYRWNDELKEKHKKAFREKYGTENPMQCTEIAAKVRQTKVKNYGENWGKIISEKSFSTYKGRTGFNNPFQDIDRIREGIQVKYGYDHVSWVPELVDKRKGTWDKHYSTQEALDELDRKRKQTKLNKYGDANFNNIAQIRKTCLERYGIEYAILAPGINNKSGVCSKPNNKFNELLESMNIEFSREFPILRKRYDFRVGKYLIEIDPTPTHNSTWNPWTEEGIDKYYHQLKSKLAYENEYRCIHVFDWMDYREVINNIINNKYSMDIIFEEPRVYYYSLKLKSLCDSNTPGCLLVYDDGAIEKNV